MKTINKYPKENTSKHIELAEGNEPVEMVNEEENTDNTTIASYEDEDSTHYSVGGDNGW